ncbi:hypothetical protein HPB51_016556 [Rhipicephalus microplus]|uniref:Uncharacterized protein n=1 Tax=Rhipicephalus microplus TaxID=6941 RepID=A0A9J6EAQ7_RHIMP|nr:hypothetical protein HPB51_016556 [Rhipicephalus microplus]
MTPVLMREPVLQDKRQEHAKFCTSCIELVERVTGAPLSPGMESSLAKINKDKRQEHAKFCTSCIELVERVTGAPLSPGMESSLAKINKSEVVAQTKISYREKDLLQLIYQHLQAKGLTDTAALLQKEAGLPARPLCGSSAQPQWSSNTVCTPRTLRPLRSGSIGSASLTPVSSAEKIPSVPCLNRNALLTFCEELHDDIVVMGAKETTQDVQGVHDLRRLHLCRDCRNTTCGFIVMHLIDGDDSCTSTPGDFGITQLLVQDHLRVSVKNGAVTPIRTDSVARQLQNHAAPPASSPSMPALQKRSGTYQASPVLKRLSYTSTSSAMPTSHPPHSLSLDTIVKEYLRNQHALCKNPVVACPPFELFV